MIMALIRKNTNTVTDVKAGKEIGDDMWSTLLAKDRIMDIESLNSLGRIKVT